MKKRFFMTGIIAAVALSLGACSAVNSGNNVNSTAAVQSVENWKPYDANGNILRTDRDATGVNGVVSTGKYEATKIGVDIIKKGGNAIDAAVAVGFALGVCEPQSSGIGGGGFMVIRFAKTGETKFIDFREIAPKNATPDMWKLDKDGKVINNEKAVGGKAVGVPGEVKGMMYALEKYGTMSRKDVIQPSVELAENGYEVSAVLSRDIKNKYDMIEMFPETSKIYLNEGFPYEVGETIKNPDLANTLRKIIKNGEKAVYEGEIAKAIVKSAQDAGGPLTMEDMQNYDIRVNDPLVGHYRGYEIVTSAPPSSGGAHVVQILNILENYDMKNVKPGSAEYYHLFSEAIKMAFADRAKFCGDTEFIDVPIDGIISKDYAKELVKQLDSKKSKKYIAGNPWAWDGSKDTTHYSIVDKEGNIVAVTKTVNNVFASGVVAEGTGIILNNEMNDFDTGHGKANSVEAGKKPLSSMSPTIVLKDGKPVMSLGAPGATRIITGVAQVISLVLDYGMDIQEAINFPRIHDDYDKLVCETRIDPAVIAKLKAMGHNVVEEAEYFEYPCVQGVTMGEDGKLRGGADPRRDGKALGF
ncbi:gamma-glutamyltransferase [Fusobacterium ulcerans]|uniref:Glutathione hydrolase proenzyme n=1 Tax=Fusobacterium ulcerans 12-1B TaxID=457404 RepID=H1PX90_9FUSO|nr:gamma-glutamyltransferase [Fusobacterium ulcerans]EHO78458.1 gamma-glutamyltransferase [Fusobacterium ulcerans 12-1B]MEE0137915.1 gamma-glutamyltransferase [Fusobacterium ulcerans]